jgi:hypothetical protein
MLEATVTTTRLLQNVAPVCSLYLYSIPHSVSLLPLLIPSAIMSRNTLSLLQSATSSLSHLATAHSYSPTHQKLSQADSNTTTERTSGSSEGPGSAEKTTEDKQDLVPPLSELEAKLKAKEDEVSDITVHPFRRTPDITAFSNLR